MMNHWFWFLIVVLVVVWYSSVTIYVSIRGVMDIKEMLRKLADRQKADMADNDG